MIVADLCKAYLADKAAAERMYRGKLVQLSGVVHMADWSPYKEEGLFVILESDTPQFAVSAWFNEMHEKQVLGLRKGARVRVAGRVSDTVIVKSKGEVIVSLDRCRIIVPKGDKER